MKTDLKELQEICRLIQFSQTNKGVKRYFNFGLFPKEFVNKALTLKIDLNDFKLFMDTSGINHVLNRHGYMSTAPKNGEIPICILDFILLKSDMIDCDSMNGNKNAIIFYKNKMKHFKVIVCEIRISNSKGKRLYLKTMYNKKRL